MIAKTKNAILLLQRLKEMASQNNGKLITNQWHGTEFKYEFEFENGLTFFRSHKKMVERGWPKNSDQYLKILDTKGKTHNEFLKDLEIIAEQNSGKLLSTEWLGNKEKYLFADSNGNQFEASYSNIKNNGWPKDIKSYLKNNDDYLEELKQIAEQNGGKLLTTEWRGSHYKYEFEFADGRIFRCNGSKIKFRGWPKNPDQFLKTADDYLQDMRDIAEKNGGKLLSTEWKGSWTKYEFIDDNNIIFECAHAELRLGKWNPDRGLVSEPICRQMMEHLFNKQFAKTRKILTPKITGLSNSLELDGYCSELNVAFEYQGYPSHWDKSHSRYEMTRKTDALKQTICKKLKIVLIQIPKFEESKDKWDSNTAFDHILKSIKNTYAEYNMDLPNLNLTNFKINFQLINHGNTMLKDMREIAERNNGELVSTEWLGNKEKYLFKFKDGTLFKRSANMLKNVGWPKDLKTYLIRQLTPEEKLQELKTLAENNDGELLSKEWLGNQEKYLFKFKDGTLFTSNANNLKKRGWPTDLKYFLMKQQLPELYLEYMQAVAEKNEGRLLSTEWLGSDKKYKFEFKDGRSFEILYDNLKQKGWPKNPDSYLKYITTKNKITIL